MMDAAKEMELEYSQGGGESHRVTVGSLPVKNVQALADAGVDDDVILKSYARQDITNHPVHSSGEVPLIDYGKLADDNEAAKLHLACEEWGFFQLTNHGISDEVIEEMKVVIHEFFQLPLEEKERFAQLPGDIEGYGQLCVVSDDQKLDWGDMIFLRIQPMRLRNMRFWPDQPPRFRDTLDIYMSKVRDVTQHLFGVIATNLGADPEKLMDMFETQSARINYYPPCLQADKVLGFSPHSDAAGITLLLQINEVQGLQIKKNGAWIPIKPLPGAFVVNIGDALEVLSNGKYKSIEHRVIVNPTKERLSIGAFHNLKPGSVVGPLSEVVKGSKECYRTTSIEEFLKLYFSRKLDGKNLIDRMKLTT